ncbi:MAG: hypothetical protein CL678_18610, partial [Bdellovibrionaceae bacterium]|nr:hypothetical protein [Pseudobdellovibrionaceae bacterium]
MTLKRFFLFTSLLFHFLLITACSENAMIQIGGEESSTPATVSVVSPPETVPPITFEHVATTENTTANYTALDPNIYSDFAYPETEIFVSNFTVNSIGGVINNAQPVLFYDMTENQWGIINLNGSPIKNGTRFNIMIPGNRGYHYQHQVVPGIGNQIQIPSDFMSLSEQEKAVIIVTPIYEIGSSLSSGAISVAREGDTWKILKEDGSAVGMNEKYNIYIPSATQTSKRVQ